MTFVERRRPFGGGRKRLRRDFGATTLLLILKCLKSHPSTLSSSAISLSNSDSPISGLPHSLGGLINIRAGRH